MTPEQRAEIRAAARRLVATWKPPTKEQVEQIAALLGPAAQETRKEAS